MGHTVKIFRTLALALALAFVPALAHAWPGTVTKIHDGDSITVRPDSGKPTKIRLWGIDCPEYRQAYGKAATEFVRLLLPIGSRVEVEEIDRDRYGRTVAIVSRGGDTVQAALLRAGLAWVYERYYRERGGNWPRIEADAKAARRGLWKDEEPTPPWVWRKMKR